MDEEQDQRIENMKMTLCPYQICDTFKTEDFSTNEIIESTRSSYHNFHSFSHQVNLVLPTPTSINTYTEQE